MTKEKDSEGRFARLRSRAEETLTPNPPDVENVSSFSPEEMQRLIHELRVHQIELDMQDEELRQAQVQLEELNEKYQDLYDFAPVGYVTLNEKGLILEANLTAAQILGVERQRLTKMFLSQFATEEFVDACHLYLRQVFETRSKQTCEMKLAREDGTLVYAQLESIAVQDETGRFNHCRTIVSDITERKQAEAALQENETFLRETGRMAKVGGWELYPDTGKVRWTEETYRIHELPLDQEPNLDEALTFFHPTDRANLERAIRRCVDLGESYDLELRFTSVKGKRLWTHAIGKPIRKDGKTVKLIGSFQDITEQKQAEEHLNSAYRSLNQIIQFLPDATLVIDDQGRVVAWNRAIEELTGVSAASIIGKGDYEYALPFYGCRRPVMIDLVINYDEQVASEYGSIRREGERLFSETYLPDFRGRGPRWLWNRAAPLYDEQGRIVGAIESVRDITELKRSEEELREREQRYRLLADNTLDMIWQTDLDLRFIYVNPAITRLTGHTMDEWIGANLRQFCDEENFAKLAQAAQEEISKGPDSSGTVIEAELLKKNREPIPVEIHGKVIFGEDGLPIGLQGVGRDITDRRRAESALKASEEKYRNLFENSPVGIISVDKEGRILEVNRPLLEILGSPSQEATKSINMFQLPQLVQTGVSDLFRFCVASGEQLQKQIPYESKWGKKSHLRFLLNPMVDQQGTVYGCQAVVEDFTEQKRLEEQLREAQKMEAVGTLAGGVAHDFSNLLQVVLGYSEVLLAEKQEDDGEYEDLQKIFHAAKSGGELVHRLLTFSRRSESNPVPMNLNSEIVQVEKLLRRTIPRMVDIDLDLSGDLPLIHADPFRVEQILMNLVLNACDAMPDGGKLTVRTSTVTLDEDYSDLHLDVGPGEYVLLLVSDTGHGMDKDTVERIFEPFFTTKGMGRGTGLGLAMVHGIVKQLNGHITVYSEVGRGTIFRVFFPALEDGAQTHVEVSAVMPAFGTETILLVDDEEFVRKLGARILTKHGYTVLQAEKGREALDLFDKERSRISLVILDLIMPGMSGKECLKELSKIDPEVKVLVTSGYAADEVVKEVRQMGARGFVNKPFRAKEFLRNVRRILDEG